MPHHGRVHGNVEVARGEQAAKEGLNAKALVEMLATDVQVDFCSRHRRFLAVADCAIHVNQQENPVVCLG